MTELTVPEHVALRETPERIDAACSKCRTGVWVHNKGLGRAQLHAWMSRHRHGA